MAFFRNLFRGRKSYSEIVRERIAAIPTETDIPEAFPVGDDDGSDTAWHPAPDFPSKHPSGYYGPSHLFAIRYRDRREHSLLPTSRLDIIFRKGKHPNQPAAIGYYVPPNDDAGREMYERLIKARWPYSSVLRPEVVNKWPWVKVSG